MEIAAKVKSPSAAAASANYDYDHMCQVTCSGCFFTFMADGLSYVTEGQVPSGATISVISGQGADLTRGYTINGAGAQQQNKVTFKLTITEDTTISMP